MDPKLTDRHLQTLAADPRDNLRRIHEALDDVALGIEKCNARGFSCDSFTILTTIPSFRNAVNWFEYQYRLSTCSKTP
jgi:hypothetical protein